MRQETKDSTGRERRKHGYDRQIDSDCAGPSEHVEGTGSYMVAPFRYPCSLPVILVTGSVKGIAGAILWLRAEERVFQLPNRSAGFPESLLSD